MAAVAVLVGVLPVSAPALADDDHPLHRVTYTVTADVLTAAKIYFRDVDPPTWAEYSHNPYQFSPRDDVSLAPGTPWIRDVQLAYPERWAMVTVSVIPTASTATQTVGCQLAVDGVVVASGKGPKGALCSIRPW